jgi:hypothetical protein
VAELQKMMLSPLDDLLAVVREFLNASASRLGLPAACAGEGFDTRVKPQPVTM